MTFNQLVVGSIPTTRTIILGEEMSHLEQQVQRELEQIFEKYTVENTSLEEQFIIGNNRFTGKKLLVAKRLYETGVDVDIVYKYLGGMDIAEVISTKYNILLVDKHYCEDKLTQFLRDGIA